MKKTNILLTIMLVLILIVGKFVFVQDFVYVLKWYITVLAIGLIFMPITEKIFSRFNDKGWIFSKIIGLAVSSWLMWILSYAKILKYTRLNCYIIIGILFIINLIVSKKNKKKIEQDKLKNILISEIIFLIIFMGWTYIRGLIPGLDSYSEKFMDYGYMNATMQTEYMPPEDIWYSGENTNYYYYGQYVSGFITKIAGLHASEGYNLMLAFIASLTFIMPYVIGYNLSKKFIKDNGKRITKVLPVIIAIISALSVSIGGTLHYPIYRWLSEDSEIYNYTNTTRYIGYNPDVKDKAITEVPVYTMVLGDLHAHFIDLIFSLTVLAILLEVLSEEKDKTIKQEICNGKILILGMILGIQKMTNYWDLPIYMVIISCIIFAKNLIKKGFTKKNIIATIVQIIEVFLIEEIITIPFSRDLHISSTDVRFTENHTALYQYFVLWGLPIVVTIMLVANVIYKFLKEREKNGSWKKQLRNFWDKVNVADLYVGILFCCGIGLTIIPEIIYLKDIYGIEYQRFNTVFKLTYNSYLIFSLCLGYTIVRLLYEATKWAYKWLVWCVLIVQISTIPYGINAIRTKYKYSKYQGISDVEMIIREKMPDDYKAIQWIKENIETGKVILEKPGDAYCDNGRISVFTGNPTVLGWYNHEWQWRADENHNAPYNENIRWQNINKIYTGTDAEEIKELIKEYDISYIYVGMMEYIGYSNKMNLELLMSLGEVVFEISEDECTRTPVYIIKVEE